MAPAIPPATPPAARPASPPDLAAIRAAFPALARPTVFMDNAGGSQLPRVVIDAVRACCEQSFAQLGGAYDESLRAKHLIHAAHEVCRTLMNAREPQADAPGAGAIILGASTTQLVYMLANCHAESPVDGRDEIVIAACGHESDVGPWARLERRGYRIRWWPTHVPSMSLRVDELLPLLNSRTRLVAFPHVSNILGEIVDAPAACAACRAVGARVIVDGVAFAPHRAIDVAALGCDYYVYSTYKVFGPHMAALYARREALSELEGPNHFFISRTEWPKKFELGGVPHEGAAAIAALPCFLRFLTGEAEPATHPETLRRTTVEQAFARMTELELPLQERLIGFLNSRQQAAGKSHGVRVIGPAHALPSRVSTIAFTVAGRSSESIAGEANRRGLALRFGHFYSARLMDELGIPRDDGVVRASFVHYTSPDEVQRLIDFLGQAIPA